MPSSPGDTWPQGHWRLADLQPQGSLPRCPRSILLGGSHRPQTRTSPKPAAPAARTGPGLRASSLAPCPQLTRSRPRTPAGGPQWRTVPGMPQAPACREPGEAPSLSSCSPQHSEERPRLASRDVCDTRCDTAGCQTWELGRGEHEGFLGLQSALHDAVTVGVCHYTFVQATEHTPAKSGPRHVEGPRTWRPADGGRKGRKDRRTLQRTRLACLQFLRRGRGSGRGNPAAHPDRNLGR